MDSPDRPNFIEAYTFGFVLTHETLTAVRSWLTQAQWDMLRSNTLSAEQRALVSMQVVCVCVCLSALEHVAM